MENVSFNFDKFVEDIERRDLEARDKNITLQRQLDAWEARRRLNTLYRENPHNRIRIKR